MSATTTSARSARGRLAALAATAALVGLGAGCSGSDSSSDPSSAADASVASTIEKSLYEAGDTQGISCENLGTFDVAGVSREVARCSFSEEKNGSGAMRSRGDCFALDDGVVTDVTLDMPAGVICFTKT